MEMEKKYKYIKRAKKYMYFYMNSSVQKYLMFSRVVVNKIDIFKS